MRDARRLTLHVKLAERPPREEPDRDGSRQRPRPRVPDPSPDVPLGLTVRELDRISARGLTCPIRSRASSCRASIRPAPAFSASIRRGFVIMEINRRPISNARRLSAHDCGSEAGRRARVVLLRSNAQAADAGNGDGGVEQPALTDELSHEISHPGHRR